MQHRSLSLLQISLPAAVLWILAHLAIHLPRGWPFPVRGEWDVLLVSMSMAAGDFPALALGALHGSSPGSYFIALLAAPLLALGVKPVLAGKVLAMLFGASLTGLCTALAVSLVDPRNPSARLWTGGLCGFFFAFAWPGLHLDFVGLSGSTPESLVFQILALVLVLTAAGRGGRIRALCSGLSVSVAWLLSPLALWTALMVPILWLLPDSSKVRSMLARASSVFWVAVGASFPLIVLVAFVPDGTRGLGLFLANDFGSAGLEVSLGGLREHGEAIERAGPLVLIAKVARSLEGGAHNAGLGLRALLLASLAWLSVASVLWILAVRRSTAGLRVLLVATIAASWSLPLSLVPLDFGFYPLAYRYWGIPLSLALVLAALLLGSLSVARYRWLRYARLALLLLCSGVLLPSLGRSMVAPAASAPEAAVGTGAHAMDPRPGYPRHAAFRQLSRHASETLRPQLSEGYGLALGADTAVSIIRGDPAPPLWLELRPELDGSSWRSLLFGIGCGASSYRAEPRLLLNQLFSGAPDDNADISRGFQFCLAGSGAVLDSDQPLPSPSMDLNSSVTQPWALLPPRF